MIDYSKKLNNRIKNVKPSAIRKFFDIANEFDDVISLSIGEPDFSTPWNIRQMGINSLEKGKTWYSPNRGFIELRKSISKWFNKHYHVEYNPKDEILVTVGASEAIDLAVRCMIEPGDEVLIVEPSFVCYAPLVTMAGGVPVVLETTEETSFRLTAEQLRKAITPKTKLLILPYPNNPTGGVMRKKDLEAIADVIRETEIIVLSDEIYSELTYGDTPHVCFAEIEGMRERTIVINGFSKAFAMTGWRLGYAVAPKELIAAMTKLHQYGLMSAPSISQYAAIEALNNGEEDIKHMRSEYDMRRRLIVSGLREIGFSCFEPEGAFYVFPCIKSTGLSSEDFCEKLIYEQKVAVVPGSAFGKSGEGYVRISYSYNINHIIEALDRIKRFAGEHQK